MIGFYDYTVVLTYISLACSIFGMTEAISGHYIIAVLCLAVSGLLDMFDGKVARTKKDRTDDEKLFGVQIDSLCDMVCFGAFPAVLCYSYAGSGIITKIVMIYYCLGAVIRLGFFNVLETNRQRVEGGVNKYYHGLPITSIAIILPFIFLVRAVIPVSWFVWILYLTYFVVGTLFVVDFQLKKPSNAKLCVLVSVTACAVVALLFLKFTKVKYFEPVNNNFKQIEKAIEEK